MTPAVLPFALLADTPAPPADRTPSHTYDPSRQLNVTEGGDAVVDVAVVTATTHTHNSKGFKKDDDFSAQHMLFGPSYTHNSEGRKKDDD